MLMVDHEISSLLRYRVAIHFSWPGMNSPAGPILIVRNCLMRVVSM
jgi:hypothetical protein